MDYTECFYRDYVGKYPFQTDKEWHETSAVISHLMESLPHGDMIFNVFQECTPFGMITKDNLPDMLWDGCLTERNRFYYHPRLQIRSKQPCYDYENGIMITYPYYLEPVERFTVDDLLAYAYKRLCIPDYLQDENRDKKALEYLLKKYSRHPQASSLDFVLYLIDESTDGTINSVIDISNAEHTAAETVKRILSVGKAKHYDKWKWRSANGAA